MPLYEFECESCKSRFERIQKFSDANPEVCPTCGKGPVRKLPSSPAIQFKGSGFYITDYAKKSSPDASPSGSKSGESKSGGDAKSGDGGASSSSSASADTAPKSTESTSKTSDKKD
jgi:putative FmdB family regulatory protein